MKRNCLHSVLSVIITAVLCATLAAPTAFAATAQMCTVNLVSSDNNVFLYEIKDTSIRFKANIKDGETSGKPVTLAVSNDCKVLSNNTSLTGIATGNEQVYTVSEAGSYTLQIKCPVNGDVAPYANFGFTVWSSPETSSATVSSYSYSGSGASGAEGVAGGAGNADTTGASGISGASSITGAAGTGNVILTGVTGEGSSATALSSSQSPYTAADGHSVVPVTLSETYFEKFNTYEQKFRDRFFYTNVANGRITNEQVYFDVPAGISVEITKDGQAVTFKNKTYISGYGSYQLKLNYFDEPIGNQPKTEYTATFRFRIQEPIEQLNIGKQPSKSSSSAAAPSKSSGSSIPNFSGSTDLSKLESLPSGSDELSDKDIDTKLNDLIGGGTKQQNLIELSGTAAYTGLLQTYDTQKGMYLQTAADSSFFYTNIPNGAVTHQDVYFSLQDGAKVTVTKDDEEYPFKIGDVFGESGVYYVKFGVSDAIFTFRIIKGPVHDLDICYAPAGFTVESVKLDDKPAAFKETYCQLQKDGKYEINFKQGDQKLTFNVTRDTLAAEFKLNGVDNGIANGGIVTAEYKSDEVSKLEVLKNGQTVNYGTGIKDAGSYEVRVYDKAGNMSSQKFTLNYRINTAGVLAILLLILLIASGVLVFFRIKQDTKVR